MPKSRPILQGALILTLTGIASRIIGFFYRIFLSHTIGAEGMGIYQMIFPIYTLCFTLCAAGLQTALSRTIAARAAQGDEKGAFDTSSPGLSCLCSFPALPLLRCTDALDMPLYIS